MEQASVFPIFKVASPLSSSPVPPVMSKGIGVLPQRARGAFAWSACLDTDTARTVTFALNYDLIFSSLTNSN